MRTEFEYAGVTVVIETESNGQFVRVEVTGDTVYLRFMEPGDRSIVVWGSGTPARHLIETKERERFQPDPEPEPEAKSGPPYDKADYADQARRFAKEIKRHPRRKGQK